LATAAHGATNTATDTNTAYGRRSPTCRDAAAFAATAAIGAAAKTATEATTSTTTAAATTAAAAAADAAAATFTTAKCVFCGSAHECTALCGIAYAIQNIKKIE
jgi:hypothetical protein